MKKAGRMLVALGVLSVMPGIINAASDIQLPPEWENILVDNHQLRPTAASLQEWSNIMDKPIATNKLPLNGENKLPLNRENVLAGK